MFVSLRLTMKLVFGALLLGVASSSAQACEIWRDEHLGVWRGNCSLAEDFKRLYLLTDTFIVAVNRPYRFKLPDLRIEKFKFFVTGSQVSIFVDVINDGLANAPAADLAVSVSIGNPLTGMQTMQTIPLAARTPALAPNATNRVAVGTVTVPNAAQDWDLILFGAVDPPTPASPTWGAIIEADETDNTRSHACRWFGPNPNPSVTPCN